MMPTAANAGPRIRKTSSGPPRSATYLSNIDFVMTMGMTGGVYPKSKGINPALTDRMDFAAMLEEHH